MATTSERDVPVYLPVRSFHKDVCEIAHLDYKQGKSLGRGVNGNVYELCDNKNQCPYVVKVLKFAKGGDEVPAQFIKEVIHQSVADKLAPKIYDAWTCVSPTATYGFIVMARMDGNLDNYVTSHAITDDRVKKIMKRLRSHVKRLHKIGIEHGDLKPENIFFRGKKWYLGDFGLSSLDVKHTSDKLMLDEIERQLLVMSDPMSKKEFEWKSGVTGLRVYNL